VFNRSELDGAAATLTLDLQNLIRSSVGASEYSQSVLSKFFKPFMGYRGNNSLYDRTNRRTGHPKHTMPSTTMTIGKGIIKPLRAIEAGVIFMKLRC